MKPRRPLRVTRGGPDASLADLDRELVVDEFAPPPPAAAERWRRARRKPGRPATGEGARVISVSVEKGLLRATDSFAKARGVSRASVVARGLRAVLAAEQGRRRSRSRRAGRRRTRAERS
jgi:hypothetical protein